MADRGIVEDARDQADRILVNARRQALELVTAAHTEVDRIQGIHADAMTTARAQLHEGPHMKLTVQRVMDATLVVAAIIRDARSMPQKGKYRVARLHAKLLPEFTTANDRREEMIRAYGLSQTVETTDPVSGLRAIVETGEFQVPLDKLDEFNAAWKEIGTQELAVDIEPIPLAMLDLGDSENGGIEAAELIALGELVAE